MSDPRRWLALGDSYTIGEGVNPEEGWPSQLWRALADEGIGLEPPRIVARTGWTTDELWSAIDDAGLQGRYDVVTLLIGVNDQYRGRSADGYRARFTPLLDRAIDLGGGDPSRVIVISVPDWGVTPFAAREGRDAQQVADEIDAYNAVNAEVAAVRGAYRVDVAPISREAARDTALIAADELHPSGLMYRRWVELLLPVVRRVLAAQAG